MMRTTKKSFLIIGLSWSLTTLSCRNAVSHSKEADAAQDAIAAEEAASQAANGSWELEQPQPPRYLPIFGGTLLGDKIKSLTVDKLRIDYNAKTGSLNFVQTVYPDLTGYRQKSPTIEDLLNIFNVRSAGNINSFDEAHMIYLPKAAKGLAMVTAISTAVLGMSVIFTPLHIINTLIVTASLNRSMTNYLNQNKLMTVSEQLSEKLAQLTNMKVNIDRIAARNNKAAYLQTIMARKISHMMFRQTIVDRLTNLKSVNIPLMFDSTTSSSSSVSLLDISPVDVDHLDKNGSPFLLINLPGEVYKVSLYPGLSMGISYTAATKSPLTWTFKNTFTQTAMVGPKTVGCSTSCFGSNQKSWQDANQHNFNQALATVRGVLLGLPENYTQVADLSKDPAYQQMVDFLAMVSTHDGEVIRQLDPRIPAPKNWVLDQEAFDESFDERMAPHLDPTTVSNDSIFAWEQDAAKSMTVETGDSSAMGSEAFNDDASADASDAGTHDDSSDASSSQRGSDSSGGGQAKGR